MFTFITGTAWGQPLCSGEAELLERDHEQRAYDCRYALGSLHIKLVRKARLLPTGSDCSMVFSMTCLRCNLSPTLLSAEDHAEDGDRHHWGWISDTHIHKRHAHAIGSVTIHHAYVIRCVEYDAASIRFSRSLRFSHKLATIF